MSGEDVYRDLIQFLKSDRADLRLAASEAVMGVTDWETMSNLVKLGVIAPLCRLSSRSDKAGMNALISLNYFSSHGTSVSQCIEDILDCGGVSRMSEIALSALPATSSTQRTDDSSNQSIEEWKVRVNYALALLANMTRTEKGAIELCGRFMPDEAIPVFSANDEKQTLPDDYTSPSKPTVALLLSRFLSDVYITESNKNLQHVIKSSSSNSNDDNHAGPATVDDPYQHFAAILMNITQVDQGRRFLMKIHQGSDGSKAYSVLEKVIPLLRSSNSTRRQGIAGTVKNCCFERDSAWWLINEVKIIPKILYPLAGPEELDIDEKKGMDPDLWLEGPDKIREVDETTRMLLVESILLLCATGRKSREALRLERTYIILKMADMVEQSETINERISDCVNFLRRDEQGTEEGSSDKFVEEAYDQEYKSDDGKILALPSPSAALNVEAVNYDSVD